MFGYKTIEERNHIPQLVIIPREEEVFRIQLIKVKLIQLIRKREGLFLVFLFFL